MALTELNDAIRVKRVTVLRDEDTGLFTLRYEAEVAQGFNRIPIGKQLVSLSAADVKLEATHNTILADLNDQLDDL